MATSDLLLGILALDSYNRSYDPGIGPQNIGLGAAGAAVQTATLMDFDLPAGSQAVGFYASAYRLADNSIVISYRGTDGLNDVTNGWVASTGTQTEQVRLALEFYEAVTGKSAFDGAASNVTLTGHSLGGGLAGLVAALSGTKAVVFDHMPFGLVAARVAADNPLLNGEPRTLHFDAVKALYTDGEMLQYVRSGYLINAVSILPDVVLYPLGLYLGVEVGPILTGEQVQLIAAKIEAFEASVVKAPLDSHWDTLNPVNLHSQALLVNLKYALEKGLTNWQSLGNELWGAAFTDEVGRAAGFTDAPSDGAYSAASKLLASVAYSTMEGTQGLVFGNVAASVMFNDAGDLGKVYKLSNLDAVLLDEINDGWIFDSSVKQALTDITVQYAGALAKYKVEQAKANAVASGLDVTDGVLATSTDTTSLALDTSSILWKDVLASSGGGAGDGNGGADNAGYNGSTKLPIIHEAELRKLLLAQSPNFQLSSLQWLIDVVTGADSIEATLSKLAQDVWQAEDGKAIDRYHFRVPAGLSDITLTDRSYDVKTAEGADVHIDVYVGTSEKDRVITTAGNDLVFTGADNDTIVLRGGRDLVFGGNGNDLFIDRVNVDLAKSADPSATTIDDIYVGEEFSNGVIQNIKNWLRGFLDTDTVNYSSVATTEGAEGINSTNALAKGIEVNTAEVMEWQKQDGVKFTFTNLNNGKKESDVLISIERAILTERRDTIRVNDAMLQAPLWIDMGNDLGANDNAAQRQKAAA